MAGFTQDQLDEQLVLIRKLYSGELSNSDFDKSMSELKDVHQAVKRFSPACIGRSKHSRHLDRWSVST